MPLQQRHQLVELPPTERPLVLPTTIASNPRSGSPTAANNRAASGRLHHLRRRDAPSSKNETTTVPYPSTNSVDISNCHNRDDALS
ncbi:hypothetical protein [Saccharothrix sp. ALI-22-I]|uniref:hypothetical protein n=1 Tax=Saccharothrix sp. ALI-22-I TaxID=1933778 RepID=UPI00097C0928|nr:hypothetical protein [Saccharothrix sp. ALI-22-I]